MDQIVKVALIAAAPPTLAALATMVGNIRNGRKLKELHVIVNSRLTELLAASKAASHAEGKAEGRIEGVAAGEDGHA